MPLTSMRGLQPRGVPAQVIGHEGGNEEVAVVIAALQTKGERDCGLRTCAFKQFRAKLFRQERIGIADIDQKIRKSGAVLDQRDCIMLAPCFLIVAEITSQRLDTPRDLRGCYDRRESKIGRASCRERV